MSILDRIISRLRDIVKGVERTAGEIHEHFERRRADALAEELDKLAVGKPYKNWRTSSQDLAFVLGEDGTQAGRAELWDELGLGERHEYSGAGPQNMRLHAALLERAAKDGIPWPEGI